MSRYSIKWWDSPELKKGTNTSSNGKKKISILRVLSTPVRYVTCKIESTYKKLVKKEPKKLLKRKSVDALKEIAKSRRTKNRGKLKKEDLITSILKSESSNSERNYMKLFNNNVDNNNVDNNADDDDTYDGKTRNKISDIRVMLSRLGDVVTKYDRVKIKKEKIRKTFQIRKREDWW